MIWKKKKKGDGLIIVSVCRSEDFYHGLISTMIFYGIDSVESDLLKYLGCENSHTVTDVKFN